jgi:hypothetical protein
MLQLCMTTKSTNTSQFRLWCQAKWYEHLDELDGYGLKPPTYSSSYYFKTYKYWLKREYQHQKVTNNV